MLADAEAYSTGVIAAAIAQNGVEAAQYQVALKQVEALNALGNGQGKQTIVLPANAIEAFGDAFKLFRARADELSGVIALWWVWLGGALCSASLRCCCRPTSSWVSRWGLRRWVAFYGWGCRWGRRRPSRSSPAVAGGLSFPDVAVRPQGWQVKIITRDINEN